MSFLDFVTALSQGNLLDGCFLFLFKAVSARFWLTNFHSRPGPCGQRLSFREAVEIARNVRVDGASENQVDDNITSKKPVKSKTKCTCLLYILGEKLYSPIDRWIDRWIDR